MVVSMNYKKETFWQSLFLYLKLREVIKMELKDTIEMMNSRD